MLVLIFVNIVFSHYKLCFLKFSQIDIIDQCLAYIHFTLHINVSCVSARSDDVKQGMKDESEFLALQVIISENVCKTVQITDEFKRCVEQTKRKERKKNKHAYVIRYHGYISNFRGCVEFISVDDIVDIVSFHRYVFLTVLCIL